MDNQDLIGCLKLLIKINLLDDFQYLEDQLLYNILKLKELFKILSLDIIKNFKKTLEKEFSSNKVFRELKSHFENINYAYLRDKKQKTEPTAYDECYNKSHLLGLLYSMKMSCAPK